MWEFGHTNPMQLFGVAPHPLCMRDVCYVLRLGLSHTMEKKCFVSISFNFVSRDHKSKKGHM